MSYIPKLRFPEFSGEWEEKKLEEICDPPKYGLNSAGIEFDGIHKYLRITDIDEITHTFSPTDITTPSEFNDEYLLNKNDIVFARTGASTGKTYLYDSNDGDLYFAGFLIKFHVKDANARFVFYQTLTHKYSKWVHVMSTRSGQPGINSEEYGSYKIKLPDIHEQQKIADFLSNVDSIITAETKILNTLQKKKKALMQKLFTQQLRFKSANGTDFPAWEEKKLGDVCDIIGGGTPDTNKAEYWNGNIQWFTPTEIGNTKYISESKRKITQLGFEKSSAKLLPVGTILFTSRATLGEMSITTVECTTNQGFQSLIPNKNFIHSDYLYYLQPFLQKYCYSKASGSTFLEISAKSLKECHIPLPCKVEQQKIADCLSSMDSLIQTQQKVVTTWQQRKKALLQQMFI
ncbi:MAG: restriction endonuclease subunit S [Treponema sp.]|nr:restriction endonuclease subunit S [Treponema sp.]